MFGTDPFRFIIVEANAVIDPHGSGCAGFRIPLFVGAVVNSMHIVIGTGNLTGDDPGVGSCVGHLIVVLVDRKHIVTFRASGVSGMNECQTLRTLFRRGITAFASTGFFDADHIHRTVTQNIAAIVQHQTVGLAGMGR